MTQQFNDAINSLIERLNGWFEAIIVNLPNFILAILVFLLIYFISGLLKKYLQKQLVGHISQPSMKDLIATFAAMILILIGLFIALGIMNLDKALTSLLAGAGVAGLAIGLALQGTLSNIFAGIFLSVKDIVQLDDWVETNGYEGTIDEINLRYVKLREADNNIVIIPNKEIVDKPFKNYGLTADIRTIINCGVGYESDLDEVKRLAIEAMEEKFPPPEDKPVEFYYLEFGDSSINFQVRYWVPAVKRLTILEVRSDGIMALKKKFNAHDINIPFPIRTVEFNNNLKVSQKENEQISDA